MKNKYICNLDYECIVPQNLSLKDILEKKLPINCLDCPHYTNHKERTFKEDHPDIDPMEVFLDVPNLC